MNIERKFLNWNFIYKVYLFMNVSYHGAYLSSIAPGWFGIACCWGKNAILYPLSWARQFSTSIGAKWGPKNSKIILDAIESSNEFYLTIYS